MYSSIEQATSEAVINKIIKLECLRRRNEVLPKI